MDDLSFSCHELRDLRHRFSEMVKITGGRDPREYRDRLRLMMEMGLSVWIAERAGRIVGTIGFMTVPGRTGFTRNPEFVAAAEAKGIASHEVQVRSLIYVDPALRGQGIAHELETRANETSRALGFKYLAAFAYDNDEIYRWIHRHGNAIDLDMIDPSGTGHPVTMVPI